MSNYFISSLWGIPLLSFTTAGVGAYVGSYLKKRAENLATKDDFDDLKSQTAALTQTTKEIEAKIDNQVWDRQRQWELTRDGAIRLMEAQGRLEQAHRAIDRASERFAPVLDAQAAETEWIAAQHGVLDAIGFLRFACWSDEVAYALTDYQVELDFIYGPPKYGLVHEIAAKRMALDGKFLKLRNALRKELRLKEFEAGFMVRVEQRGDDHS